MKEVCLKLTLTNGTAMTCSGPGLAYCVDEKGGVSVTGLIEDRKIEMGYSPAGAWLYIGWVIG